MFTRVTLDAPVIKKGKYRIRSFVKPDLCLELQADSSVKAAKLDDSRNGQRWDITPMSATRYQIASELNSLVLSVKPSNKPELAILVGNAPSTPAYWNIEPRHDCFVIGVYNEERVIGLAEGKNAYQFSFQIMNQPVALAFGSEQASVSEINGRPHQRWILEMTGPSRADLNSVIDLGAKYMFRNRGNGRVIWLAGSTLVDYPHDDGDPALYFKFKQLANGGIALKCVGSGNWVGPQLQSSMMESGHYFIPEPSGGNWYFITDDMSPSSKVIESDDYRLVLSDLDMTNAKQMWQLVVKN